MASIETGTVMVDGVSTFFRRVKGDGPPAVFVHGNPSHSEDWQPFLERIGGPALAFDLPGWGRSGLWWWWW
jgi:pimeloyl-ACP methyl ester carboxylesterase